MLEPILIDTAEFTHGAKCLEGVVRLSELDKRVGSLDVLAEIDDLLTYQFQGGVNEIQKPFIDLTLQGELSLICQRCMQPCAVFINEVARIILFASEQEADDIMLHHPDVEGIVWQSELDLRLLIEDQILMAIPFSPKHEVCEHDVMKQADEVDLSHPFAQLAKLSRKH